MSFPNINEMTVLLGATTTPQNILCPFWPVHVYVTNSGTVPVYIKAGANSTITLTAPVAGTFSSFTEVLPGRDAIFNWSTTFSTKYLEYVTATGTANITVKLTRAEATPT